MKKCISFLFLFAALTAKAQYKLGPDGELVTEHTVSFKANSDLLLPESTEVLEFVKKYLEEKKYVTLMRIEANVSASGESSNDELLAEKRAAAVFKKLTELGVDCKRLLAVSFGSNKPAADPSTAEGKAANSYIRFMNIAINGRIIGGKPEDGGGKQVPDNCRRDIPRL